MRQEILDHFVADLSQSSEHTQRSRAFYAGKFLQFAGDRPFSEWNKTLVNDFLRELEEEGYAPGTIHNVYSIVKRVFDSAKAVHKAERARLISGTNANNPGAVAEILKAISLPGPSWDVGKRAAPKVSSGAVVKPAATLEEMQTVIAAAKGGVLTPGETAYLALSSVYGLRREELCRVREEHLNFQKNTIYVLTVKGGEQRHQLLCDEVIPYLKAYRFQEEYSPYNMWAIYQRIWAKAGIRPRDGSGWHSPRRYLDTTLVNVFGELYAHIFLRWKLSSSSRMTERYYSQDPLQIDEEILTSGHPLVELWR